MVDDHPEFAEDGLAIDWVDLLKNIGESDGVTFSGPASADSACGFSIDDIEQYLLNDESDYPKDDDHVVMDYGCVSDLFPDMSESEKSKDSSGSPDSETAVAMEVGEKEDEDKSRLNSAAVKQTEEKNNDVDEDDDDNDQSAKKRKRQMRNRDAAVRSRERKKMLVKDLEMKSKFYEAECRRLGILLQCCVAENQALRLSLHHAKAYDASTTKQESAVLLLESLLLGSLLGFMGTIMCLLILLPSLAAPLLKNGESAGQGSENPAKTRSRVLNVPFNSFFMGRRCRASRSRMKRKPWFFPTQIVI